MAQYREGIAQRRRQHRLATAKRERRAWIAAREAAEILRREFGASRVVLYGSLATGHFTHWSDVDLAAEGVPDRDWLRVGVVTESVSRDIPVNIALMQDLRPEIMAEVVATGREL